MGEFKKYGKYGNFKNMKIKKKYLEKPIYYVVEKMVNWIQKKKNVLIEYMVKWEHG